MATITENTTARKSARVSSQSTPTPAPSRAPTRAAIVPSSPRAAQANVARQNNTRISNLVGAEGSATRAANDTKIIESQQQLTNPNLTSEQRVGLQNQINLLKGGVGIPSQGLQTAQQTQFKSTLDADGKVISSALDNAKKAASDYWSANATSDPGIDAAIYLLQNPGAVKLDQANNTGGDVLENLQRQYQANADKAAIYGQGAGQSQDSGLIDQIRILRQSGYTAGIDANGEISIVGPSVSGPATPEQIEQNKKNRTGIMNPGFNVSASDSAKAASLESSLARVNRDIEDTTTQGRAVVAGSGDNPVYESWAEYEARRASLEQQRTQLLQQGQIMNQNQQQQQMAAVTGDGDAGGNVASDSTVVTGGEVKPSGDMGILPPQAGAVPGQQFPYDPNDAAGSLYAQAAAAALERLNATKAGIGEADTADRDSSIASAKKDYLQRLDIVDELDKVKRDRAEEQQRRSLAENSRMEAITKLENSHVIWEQMQSNVEGELRARRRNNQIGGGRDLNGLKYIQTEVYRGEQTVNNMKAKALLMEQKYSDNAINYMNDYYLALQQDDADKHNDYQTKFDDYRKEVADIKKDFNATTNEKLKLKAAADEAYNKILNDIDMEKAGNMEKRRTALEAHVWDLDKQAKADKEKQFDDGIQLFNLMKDKNISASPASIAYAENMMGLKPGSLAIIAASGDSNGISGFSADEVDTAKLAFFQTYGKLPPKDELPTMVQTYYRTRTFTQGESGVGGKQIPSVPINPFDALALEQKLTSLRVNYNKAVQQGYTGTITDFNKNPWFFKQQGEDAANSSQEEDAANSSQDPLDPSGPKQNIPGIALP